MRKRGSNDTTPVVTSTGRVRTRYVHTTRLRAAHERLKEISVRTVGSLVSIVVVLPILPLILRDRSVPLAQHEFTVGEPLLTGELRIVDTSADDAEALARPLRESGVPVVTYAPDVLEVLGAEPLKSTWWITNRVAAHTSIDVVKQMQRRGDRVFLDGDSPLARTVLELAPPATRHPTLPRTATGAVMRGVRVSWEGDVNPLVPRVKGRSIGTTYRGTTALFMTSDSNVMWSPIALTNEESLTRLPFLAQELAEEWNVGPRAERAGFDLFVEVDDQHGNVIRSFPVESWAESGVTRVFVPAWKYDEKTGDQYAYKSLVSMAHKNNIEVWAWLEWPHVAFKFWDVHPECRERSADGRLAKIGWREHVALTDPACFDLAWKSTKEVLTSAPFDGVNIADLYFESVFSGHRDARSYTPFHPSVRKDFEAKFAWDPKSVVHTTVKGAIPSPEQRTQWRTYREDKLLEIYTKLLARVAELKQGRKIALTLIDDRTKGDGSTLIRENSAQATAKILSLQPKYGFEVIVRDPLPFREVRPADVLAGFRGVTPKKTPVKIGISGLSRIGDGLPTKRPVGLEFARSVSDVARTGASVSIFGVDPSRADDLSWVKYALASSAKVSESGGVVHTDSPVGFTLRLAKQARNILIDGSPVGTGNNVYVPAGRHQVTVAP